MAEDRREAVGPRQAWAEGVESGDAGELDFAELKAEARRLKTNNELSVP
ncbi:MAG: hypothetical protein ACRYG8_20430 [Janthinobacterium lividum]